MKQEKFSITKQLKSFKYALNGLRIVVKEEHNARIHLFAMVVVLVAGFVFNISIIEWIVILFCIGLVFVTELINSAIENLADFISLEKHELIKKTKDLAAAAVLVSAIVSAIVGLVIFVPKIIFLCLAS